MSSLAILCGKSRAQVSPNTGSHLWSLTVSGENQGNQPEAHITHYISVLIYTTFHTAIMYYVIVCTQHMSLSVNVGCCTHIPLSVYTGPDHHETNHSPNTCHLHSKGWCVLIPLTACTAHAIPGYILGVFGYVPALQLQSPLMYLSTQHSVQM